MELGTGLSTGNHNDLFTQSQNIISVRCIFAQAVLLFTSNLCSGNHSESLASDKFHYDMRFEKKDVFRRHSSVTILQIPAGYILHLVTTW